MVPTIPRDADAEQIPESDNVCVVSFQLVNVGSTFVEFFISDAEPLTPFVAGFEKFDVTYFEFLEVTAPIMCNPKKVKIAKARKYFHACLSSQDL